jgi:hypothetical protein
VTDESPCVIAHPIVAGRVDRSRGWIKCGACALIWSSRASKRITSMLKFIGGTVGVIFLIGLLVVIGLLSLIF